jgi:natural product biosynthesis luciferase-like monooxygenase protein
VEFAVFALPTYYADRDGPEGPYFRYLVDFLASAEELGYDGVWANEHHFHPYGGMIPSPAVMLAALSQRTNRVRLGTSVMVLPLHNPLDVAEQLAMVDLMSGGRLELGVGRGFGAFDYEVHKVPYEEGHERNLECLEIILKAWSRERFSHDGKWHQYENLEVWPRPQQMPHPPVWVAATTTESSFETIGRLGHNLLTVAYLRPLEGLGALTRVYRDALAAAGHTGPTRVATHYQVVLSDDRREARQIAKEALQRYVRLNFEAQSMAKVKRMRPETAALAQNPDAIDIDSLVEQGRVLAGTPDDAVAIVERARAELGLTGVDCTFTFGAIDWKTAERSMRLFATEVIPRVRASELVTVKGN